MVGVELGVGRSLGTESTSNGDGVVLDTLLLSSAMDSSSGCRLSVDDRLDERCSSESLNEETTLLPPLVATWWAGDAPPEWWATGGDGDEACEKVRCPADTAAAGEDSA